MAGTIKTISDPRVPVGKCVVRIDDVVVYAGRLGWPMIHHIVEGAELYLNPYDFADGEAFRKKHTH